MTQPDARLALSPLRRRAVATGQLRMWLKDTISHMDVAHFARSAFQDLYRQFSDYRDKPYAREQIARVYKDWFDTIATSPTNGRSMAMFQDLAAAYALGKTLTDIEGENPGQRPESVVEPLMLNCL